MSSKKLHIVSFDVPFPANYGGAIDVFYRLKALHELGVEITLHCFEYGRGHQEKLNEFAHQVIYYPRKKNPLDWLSKKPFIVQTRRSKTLLQNLLKDDAPILFEGLHTTYFLSDPRLANRLKMVRTHNIEHDYYFKLAEHSSGWKKSYFNGEAKKLKRYENVLRLADVIFAITPSDLDYFSQYSTDVCHLNPCFNQKAFSQKETKPYVLFHGNLSVYENSAAVNWLCEHVFDTLKVPFIVAGKDPNSTVIDLSKNGFFELHSNPSEDEMNTLISEARVHVLVTHQATGIKLKLINSLQTSGHILANPTMVEGTHLTNFCTILEHPYEWKHAITESLKRELLGAEFVQRKTLFETELSVLENCRKLVAYLP